jgi:hypothetical protein
MPLAARKGKKILNSNSLKGRVTPFKGPKAIERFSYLSLILGMTLEMNVFNIYKQLGDDNDLQEVDFIEKLFYDQFENTSSEIEFNESEDLQMVYFHEESKASNWRQKLRNCHHDKLSPYLQVFNHQNLI